MDMPKLELFNTLTGDKQTFTPINGNKVSMYVCGPTVYDDAHLGHARCYITWDVLYRFLKFLGYNVTYVRNVTDVDDKILNRAKERNELPSVLAERNYQSFADDMRALNVLPPDEEPRATHHIQDMLDGIQALIQNKAAYAAADGSVYFRVASKADYGKLSKKPLDDLKVGARVEVDPNKESPLDFALWKAVSLDDPNGWESPWPAKGQNKGWGRPGWHMECSAMNHAIFGDQIDIHAGGADLIFPHHENEIAQSEAWTGKAPFAKYWMHNGFVNVSGEKMSKSLGNFSTVKKVLERYDANTIRYFLLTNHYRMPVDFNDEAVQAAENWVKRVFRTLRQLCDEHEIFSDNLEAHLEKQVYSLEEIQKPHEALSPRPIDIEFHSMFSYTAYVNELRNDLNTPNALAVLNRAISKLNEYGEDILVGDNDAYLSLHRKFLCLILTMMNVLGFDLNPLFAKKNILPPQELDTIAQKINKRKQAKAEKNWAEADAIRNELISNGLQLLDNKDGTTSVEKDGVEIARV